MQMEATRSVGTHTTAERPEFAVLLDRVRKLLPDIDQRAGATEKAKRVPNETMDALRDTGIFRAMQPERFGGYEYGPARTGADRIRTGPRLRQHRLVRHARRLLRMDDRVLPARSAGRSLGRSGQSARRLLHANTEGRSRRRRHQDLRQMALGIRRRQFSLADPRRDDPRQRRSADACLVPGAHQQRHHRS